MHELAQQIRSHLHAMWRYRWLAIICAWVVAVGGGIVVMSLPNRYEASARVYVDTESVLRPLLAGMAVQPNMDQLLTMMSRTLISRPNMEKVIRMADMEIRLKTPDDRERMIDQLIKGLAIKSAGRENLYTISYSDRNPQEAKRIVQSVLTLFVESSLGDKRKDNDSARRFLDEQLKTYAEKLAASENAVTEFKRKRMGLMPGDGGNFYTRLGEAKAQLEGATLALKEAENSRDALKLQVSGSGEMPPDLLGERGVSEDVNPELDARIQEMLKKLDSLRLTYTELHPDIVALTRSIAQLKEQKQREAKLRKPAPNVAQTQTPFYQQMGMALASAESNVAAMKARVQEYERRYAAVKATANSIPQTEAEYTQLTRDYEVTKKNYESLLSRRESAQISGDMEANASTMNFRVIDPPQVPSVSNWPNRPLLISGVLLAALGAGLALAFLMSQLRPTMNDERRLREISGLPVLGTVVMSWTEAQKKQRKKGLVALAISFGSLVSAYAALMAVLMLTAARA